LIFSLNRLIWVALLLGAMAKFAVASEISWVDSYSTALSKARSSNRLMMIFIYSDWCPYCRQLNKVTYPDPTVVAKSRQVVPFKINADLKQNKPFAKKFGLLGFPTILFVDGREQIQGKIPGYEGPQAFAADIDRFVAGYKSAPAMKARLGKNPRDGEANGWMAALSAWRGDVNGAEHHLEIAKKSTYRGIWYPRALCAIGDIHQIGNRIDRAIPLFREAARTARDPYDMGYAKISIMFCYSMKNEKDLMLAMAREILATPGMMEEYKDTARQMLKKASLP
jgi:thioredoxin-related protein